MCCFLANYPKASRNNVVATTSGLLGMVTKLHNRNTSAVVESTMKSFVLWWLVLAGWTTC